MDDDTDYIGQLETLVNSLTDEINDLDIEIKRMHWYLSQRINDAVGMTMLEDYQSVNPLYIDARMHKCDHALPPIFKVDFDVES